MKKILFFASALAGLLLAGSCQREEFAPAAEGNVVTFEVEIPEIATKANVVDDGTNINDLVYAVYRTSATSLENAQKDENLQLIYQKNYETDPFKGGNQAVVPIELINDQNYLIVFWAQVSDAWVNGNSNNLMRITYPTEMLANNSNLAAFTNATFLSAADIKGGAIKRGVTLKRPFAQIRIGTTLPKNVIEDVVLTRSSVTVNGVAEAFNALKQDIVENQHTTVEFKMAEVPYGNLTVNNVDYKYAAMNYIFANGNVGVAYNIETAQHGTVTTEAIPDVPVQRNYRTNIVGNLLTSEADYTVTLDQTWAGAEKDVVLVNNTTGLQEAINNAESGVETEIKLGGDIDLGDLSALIGTLSTKAGTEPASIKIPAGKTITLDLNGYSITGVDETTGSFGLININPEANLTIIGPGSIKLKATNDRGWGGYSSVVSNQRGTLTVNGGAVIEHLGGTAMAYGIDNLTNTGAQPAITNVNGATVISTYRAIRQFLNSASGSNELYIKDGSVIESKSDNKSIWMQDASKSANLGTLVVESGAKLNDDVLLEVAAGSTEWPVSVSIAASALQGEADVLSENVPALYDVVLKDGYWTVESSYSFGTFVETVIEAKGTYDGDGKTVKILPISGRADNTNGCLIPNRLQKYGNPDVYYAQYQRFAELEDVNISNVNFIFVPSALTVQDAWNTAGATTTAENVNGELQFMNTGSVTLTNCTFDKVAVSPINATSLTVADCQFDDLMAYAIKDINAATTSVTGTDFKNCNGGFWFNAAPTTVTATGNTFTTVGRRGAIQFSAAGDYSNTTLEISGNEVDGAFLWQLNKTITASQIEPVISNNTFTTAYVEGSIIPAYAAKIGDTKYDTLQEAFNAGGNITLLRNITVDETVVLSEDVTVVLDLNGKTLAAADKNVVKNNGGNLTIKNGTITRTGDEVGYSVNNASGEIVVENATVQRGLYTSGSKLTATNANISHEQSTRHAIYAWNCEVTINSGTFHNDNAGNATLMASGSSVVTINGGTFSIADGRSSLGWTSSMIDQNSTAQVLVKGGLFNGGFRINSADTKLTIEGGEFNTNNGSAFTDYSGTKVVKGGKFTDAGAQNWAKKYLADGYILAGDEVKKAYVVNDAASLIETITNAEAGAYIVVENALECNETVSLPANSTLALNADVTFTTLKAVSGATITIQDGKTLTLNNFSFGSKEAADAEYKIKGGTVTANYGFFQHGEYSLYSTFETGYMYYSYGSDITVYGTFHSQGKGDGLDYVRGKLTIAKGGKSIHDKSLWVGQPASWGAMNASLVIEDGGYVQANSLSVYEGSSLTYSNDADLKYNSVTGTEYITKK